MLNQIILHINGRDYPVEVEPGELLVDVLRDKLDLTGTKKGCATGDCGACSVILDGRLVDSCMVLAVAAEGKSILTIEGVAQNGNLHPVQQALLEKHGVQCGYCTPGMVMAAKALLDENPRPSEEEIRRGISGNLCRCTGYQNIVEAIQAAADALDGGR